MRKPERTCGVRTDQRHSRARSDPTPPLPPKAKRTWLWITLGAIVAPMVLGAVLALLVSNGTAADAAPTPSATQTAESAEEVEPAVETVEPEPPTAEQGTFENPYPAGFEYIISDLTADVEVFTVSARLVPVAEQHEVLGGAEAKPAPEGMRNEIVEYTVTGLDPNRLVNPGMESISWRLVDQDGTQLRRAPRVDRRHGRG